MKTLALVAALLVVACGARAFDEARTDDSKKPVPQPKLKTTGLGAGPTDPFATSSVKGLSAAGLGKAADNSSPCDPKKDKSCKQAQSQQQQAAVKAKTKPKVVVRPRGKGTVDGGSTAVPGQQSR